MAMKHYCDYDALEHYPSGTFNSQFKTDLQGKLLEVERASYEPQITSSFKDGDYKTFRTLAPIRLYRVFGLYKGGTNSELKGARLGGGFASTEFAESIIDAKLRLALAPAWFNTKMYEAMLIVPIGEMLSIGIVASVKLNTGTVLPGGADQVLLPYGWPEDWITGYRRLTSRQLQSLPYFTSNKPTVYNTKETLYTRICPACGCEEIHELSMNEQFTISGCKGNQYTMHSHCLNPECQYYW